MEHRWRVTVWGVRGSVPVPAGTVLKYGGNTSCISIDFGSGMGNLVVFDAGSGLLNLGKKLMGRRDVKRVDLFLGHLHLDHVLGLFAFEPFFDPEMEIHLYGEAREGKSFEGQLETLVGRPYWPVKIKEFPAKVFFHEIGPGASFLLPGHPDVTVRTLRGNHLGGSLLYRLDGGGRSILYALDCETDEEIWDALVDFAKEAGLLIWDANFTSSDLKKGWGHSTWEQGVALRKAANVTEVLMTHYCWNYTDAFLDRQEELAKDDTACRFAREGMTIEL